MPENLKPPQKEVGPETIIKLTDITNTAREKFGDESMPLSALSIIGTEFDGFVVELHFGKLIAKAGFKFTTDEETNYKNMRAFFGSLLTFMTDVSLNPPPAPPQPSKLIAPDNVTPIKRLIIPGQPNPQ